MEWGGGRILVEFIMRFNSNLTERVCSEMNRENVRLKIMILQYATLHHKDESVFISFDYNYNFYFYFLI